eukprot:gene10527-11632_t
MATNIDDGIIYKAINEVRLKQRQRPDKESISNYILVRNGLGMVETLNTIDNMLEAGKIYNKKTANGEDSFFASDSTTAKNNMDRKKRSNLSTERGEAESVVVDDSILGDAIQHGMVSPTTTGPEGSPSEGCADSTNLIISSVMKMVDSINLLNRMAQEERNKSCELLKENLILKLQNREFETTIECILSENNGIPTAIPNESAVNNSEKSSAEKCIEIGSELITEAEHFHKEKHKSQLSNNNNSRQDTRPRVLKRGRVFYNTTLRGAATCLEVRPRLLDVRPRVLERNLERCGPTFQTCGRMFQHLCFLVLVRVLTKKADYQLESGPSFNAVHHQNVHARWLVVPFAMMIALFHHYHAVSPKYTKREIRMLLRKDHGVDITERQLKYICQKEGLSKHWNIESNVIKEMVSNELDTCRRKVGYRQMSEIVNLRYSTSPERG